MNLKKPGNNSNDERIQRYEDMIDDIDFKIEFFMMEYNAYNDRPYDDDGNEWEYDAKITKYKEQSTYFKEWESGIIHKVTMLLDDPTYGIGNVDDLKGNYLQDKHWETSPAQEIYHIPQPENKTHGSTSTPQKNRDENNVNDSIYKKTMNASFSVLISEDKTDSRHGTLPCNRPEKNVAKQLESLQQACRHNDLTTPKGNDMAIQIVNPNATFRGQTKFQSLPRHYYKLTIHSYLNLRTAYEKWCPLEKKVDNLIYVLSRSCDWQDPQYDAFLKTFQRGRTQISFPITNSDKATVKIETYESYKPSTEHKRRHQHSGAAEDNRLHKYQDKFNALVRVTQQPNAETLLVSLEASLKSPPTTYEMINTITKPSTTPFSFQKTRRFKILSRHQTFAGHRYMMFSFTFD